MGVDLNTKNFIITGVSAPCWPIWISKNDLVFNKAQIFTYLHVLFRLTHWPRLWTQLQRSEDAADLLRKACRHLEMVAMQFLLIAVGGFLIGLCCIESFFFFKSMLNHEE